MTTLADIQARKSGGSWWQLEKIATEIVSNASRVPGVDLKLAASRPVKPSTSALMLHITADRARNFRLFEPRLVLTDRRTGLVPANVARLEAAFRKFCR